MSTDLDRIREALQFIPAGGHDERVRIAFMVKSELGESGRDLWDEWRGDRGNDEAASVWKSIREDGPLKIGTLFHEAKAAGWRDEGDYQKPTAEELAERKRIAAERALREEAEIALERADTAKKATAILKGAGKARADHPYLVRKQVSPTETLREIEAGAATAILGYPPKSGGEPLTGRLLVVPVKQGNRLSTLELIDEAGRKAALAGRGSKTGGYWATERLPEGDGAGPPVMIGEGVATCLSASQATGHPAIAALSSGNLMAVAKAMRERYPAAEIVVLADLVKATGEPDHHAIEAAQAAGGKLAVPEFGNDRDPGMTDFNDMAVLHGQEAVGRAILVDRLKTEPIISEGGEAQAIPDVTERPCFRVFDDWKEHTGGKLKPGVWHFGQDRDGNDTQSWVCSPLHIDAITFDGQSNNFGRMLRFRNSLGKWRTWAMPMELLRAAGDELRGELLSMGVELDHTPKGRQALPAWLQWRTPAKRMHCATQTGWTGKSFVLPDTVIGPNAGDVIFQSGEHRGEEHTQAGTLSGWTEGVGKKATGNPLLLLALSAGFAGPMLARCNAEGGGVHFVGDSSTGKTTAIEAACSIWGGPNYRRSWKATANGMEGVAALFNDCLLALDEISECDPREVGAIVYALGNGRGKQRASRTGTARGVTRWRCFVLSSGERTIGTTMQEGGHRAKAGQAVRLLDIPVARQYGAWDTLHDAASAPSFSDGIKYEATQHHGMVGRAFLEKLTQDGRDFCAMLETVKTLPLFESSDKEGQGKRAAARFALIGLSGELATEYGLTGWEEGEAIHAASECFHLWISTRGKGNDERRQIAERMSDFIERHGDGRFSDASAINDLPVRDRAGWWRDTQEGREYLLTAEAMREALRGFDFARALDVLQEIGAVPKPGGDGKRARFLRVGGRGMKLYQINHEKLIGDDNGT